MQTHLNRMPLPLLSEAQIQAEFYMHSRIIGLPCALEVTTPVGRLDIGVFNAEWTRLLAVIECKKIKMFSPAQIGRYKRIGVPVFGLYRMCKAQPLAEQLKRDYFDNPNHKGVNFHDDVLTMKRAVRGKGLRRLRPEDCSPTAFERLAMLEAELSQN